VADARRFLAELKRRNVLRAAVLYAGAAWALAQGIAQLAPPFGIPDWVTRWFVIACVFGFPFWLGLAWFYELTPQGLKRESEVAPADAIVRRTHRRLDYWIIAVLTVAVVLLGTNQFVLRRDATGNAVEAERKTIAEALSRVPEKSLAVLPLVNESGDRNEQYFSDGLSEDLINALSQLAGLKVISRHSSFQFRDSKASPAEIGARLGVAHLLEGSVRRQGQTLRISAVLVRAADGAITWSQQYDRPVNDLFRVQDEITRAVADALRTKLLTAPGAMAQGDRPPGGNLDAYVAYLRGANDDKKGTESGIRDAIAAYEEAIRIDPQYAAAHARLSLAWTRLASQYLGGPDAQQAYVEARAAANTALALDSGLSLAHVARATLILNADMDWTGAEAEARRALQLAPNDAYAKFALGNKVATLGRVRDAVALTSQALQTDPLQAAWYAAQGMYLTALGRLDEAERAVNTAISLRPDAGAYYRQFTMIALLRGDADAALAAARREAGGIWRNIAIASALQIGPDRAAADAALRKLIAEQSAESPYQIAQVYALRGDPDRLFAWLDKAWVQRDPGIGFLLYDPLILRHRDDPRFAAFCRKVGLPSITDAAAMP